MRVCFFSRRYFPAISGMSVYAQNLLRELVAMGHDVTMISQYRGDEEGTRVYGGGPPPPVPGVRVIGLEALGEQEKPVANFERDIETMVEAAAAEHARQPFDLLHAQYGYPTGLAALLASKRLGVPNAVSIQGGDGHWVGVHCCATHREAMRTVLGHAGALFIGSRSFAEEVRESHGTSVGLRPRSKAQSTRLKEGSRFKVQEDAEGGVLGRGGMADHASDDHEGFTIVPGAVEAGRFCPRAGWQAGEWIDPAVPVILYHGRVDRRKGALDLLDAFALLRRRGHPVAQRARLLYSGIGPDSAAVAERVRELELEEAYTGLGYVNYDDVPTVYRRGDIFASPTYSEGFSNTILEAMSAGLPIVSCHAVGVVDCLRDGENGLLVQPGDVPALADALARLLDDAPLRRRLAECAFEEAHRLYSWPVVARQIAGVYEGLRGTEPDNGWTLSEPLDVGCKYRSAPHLL